MAKLTAFGFKWAADRASEDPEDSDSATLAARVPKPLAKPKAAAADSTATAARAAGLLKPKPNAAAKVGGKGAQKPVRVRKVVQGDLGKPKVPPTSLLDQSAPEVESAAESDSAADAPVDRSAANGNGNGGAVHRHVGSDSFREGGKGGDGTASLLERAARRPRGPQVAASVLSKWSG